jgi:hypothetical protein
MVFLPHVGVIEISDAIVLVKADQQLSVSYRNIPGHL